MTENTAKIRMKVGAIEIEYEGVSSFLKEELVALMEKTVALCAKHRNTLPVNFPEDQLHSNSSKNTLELDHSTNTIATLTNAASGPDLIIAAAAHLTIVQNKGRISRSELLSEVQTATSFYKASYRSNLSNYLDRLVKADRLRLVAPDTYSLAAPEMQRLETNLAASS
jgi:hypothetical protein